LAGRCLHDNPPFQTLRHSGAEFFQASYLVTPASGVLGIHAATQRFAPELSGCFNAGGFAVDQDGA
jgi:hypothetical protein